VTLSTASAARHAVAKTSALASTATIADVLFQIHD
jgi:hypothetical protein